MELYTTKLELIQKMDLKRAVYWNLSIFRWWEPPLNSVKNRGVTIHIIPCGSIRFRLERVAHSLPYWKFSRGGWRTAFLPGNTKWRTKCYRLCSSIINAQFEEFWIPILQLYNNNSLRAPWKSCAKIEPKSKRGSKESWIDPNGHNRD